MRRRTLFRRTLDLGAAAALILTGCSNRDGTDPPGSGSSALPTGPEPVASWSLLGGYLPAGRLALRPPRLAVYASGDVVADATYRTDLTVDDVAALVDRLAADLRGPDAAKRKEGVGDVADAPTTVLTVRSVRGMYSAQATALDELRQKSAYPAALYDARDRIGEIHQRVVSTGQPYTAQRVRLVAESGPSSSDDVKPWPTSIAVPEGGDVRLVDVDGTCARDVVRLLPRDLDLNGAWPTYRTPSGLLLRASWRYLLPNE